MCSAVYSIEINISTEWKIFQYLSRYSSKEKSRPIFSPMAKFHKALLMRRYEEARVSIIQSNINRVG